MSQNGAGGGNRTRTAALGTPFATTTTHPRLGSPRILEDISSVIQRRAPAALRRWPFTQRTLHPRSRRTRDPRVLTIICPTLPSSRLVAQWSNARTTGSLTPHAMHGSVTRYASTSRRFASRRAPPPAPAHDGRSRPRRPCWSESRSEQYHKNVAVRAQRFAAPIRWREFVERLRDRANAHTCGTRKSGLRLRAPAAFPILAPVRPR